MGSFSKLRVFYDLFVDFKGYVDFFFLQDCVSEDYSSVNIWMGDASFRKSGLPETVEEYFKFLLKEHIFLDKRNNGVVLNSIHSKENCFLYLKEVVNGESYIVLSKEEIEALKIAEKFGSEEDVIANYEYDMA